MNRIFFIVLGLFLIAYIYRNVRKKMFSEKDSFFWMLGGIIILILSIFPFIVDYLAEMIGISYPPSLLFLTAITFILIVLLRQNQSLSVLNEKTKELTQIVALLEEQLRKK